MLTFNLLIPKGLLALPRFQRDGIFESGKFSVFYYLITEREMGKM